MQATSTLDRPVVAPLTVPSRSWSRAFGDIRRGIAQRELWAHLGWQDIKQRYRRSVLGPLWITISMGVMAVGLSLLYSLLLNTNTDTFLPYVTTGFIVWGFVNGCILEGMECFIANEGLIKHLPAPLTVYVFRTVWRQTLTLAHNLVIYVIILVLFFPHLDHAYSMTDPHGLCGQPDSGICYPGLSWWALTALPGFVLLALNGTWVALLFGIVSTRYRDIPQVINSFIQLVFYLTPIVWSIDTVTAGDQHPWAKFVLNLNPLYHYIQILRAPMIGQAVAPVSWLAVAVLTVVGWTLALLALRNYRARVSYWV